MEKQKCQNLGLKMPYLGIFWAGILENYCHIWNQYLRICLIAKLCGESKMLKLRTKKVLFGYFGAEIWKKKSLYLKWASSSLFNCKISWNIKNVYIWDQKCLIFVILGKKLKKLLSYLKSAPSNFSNCKILRKNKNA